MFNDEGEKICGRYTVIYEGVLFYGDSDGLNFHDYDRWDEVSSLMNAHDDFITVKDNEYCVTWANGEWY
jgi:hypothetical protein